MSRNRSRFVPHALSHGSLGGPARVAAVRLACLLLVVSLLLPAFVLSAGPSRAESGKYAAEFLRLGVGARALGMGGGFVALANDASAAYWNPAGITGLPRAEMLFMHAEQFGTLANHDFIGFVQPLQGGARRSGVGIGLIRYSVDDIQVTRDAYQDLDQNGQWDPGEPILTDQFQTDSDTEYGLLLSYAREVADRLSVGGNVKLIRQGLLSNTSFGMGLDLGFLFRPTPSLSLGARINDATTTRISWDTGTRETLKPSVNLGVSWTQNLVALNGTLTGGVALASSYDNQGYASQFSSGAMAGDLQGGIEYWYGRTVAARVGSDAGNLTAGAGLRFRSLGADYAYLAHEELDATHRVSASVQF